MSQQPLRALPDDIRDLLALEREAPLPAGVEQRVLARVERSIAAPPAATTSPATSAGASKAVLGAFAAALLAIGGAGLYLATADDAPPASAVPVLAEHLSPSVALPVRRPVSVAEPTAAKPAAATSDAPAADTLAEERAVLDIAQAAIVAGDGGTALAAVDDHRRRFGRGKLAEERAALRVQALVVAGQLDEARRRGAEFLARYPRSIQRAAVRAALEAVE